MNDRLEIASRLMPVIYDNMLRAMHDPCESLIEFENRKKKLTAHKAADIALDAAFVLIQEEVELSKK